MNEVLSGTIALIAIVAAIYLHTKMMNHLTKPKRRCTFCEEPLGSADTYCSECGEDNPQ